MIRKLMQAAERVMSAPEASSGPMEGPMSLPMFNPGAQTQADIESAQRDAGILPSLPQSSSPWDSLLDGATEGWDSEPADDSMDVLWEMNHWWDHKDDPVTETRGI